MSGRYTDIALNDGVGELSLCRPERRNALGQSLVDEAVGGLHQLEEAGAVVCVLRGRGPAFCSGADMSESPSGGRSNGVGPPGSRLVDAIRESRMLWIAGLHGAVVGYGVILACACAITIAEEGAWLWAPEWSQGRFPSAVCNALGEAAGRRVALNIALSGRKVTASEGVSLGLITEVCAAGELDAAIGGWTERLMRHRELVGAAQWWWGTGDAG